MILASDPCSMLQRKETPGSLSISPVGKLLPNSKYGGQLDSQHVNKAYQPSTTEKHFLSITLVQWSTFLGYLKCILFCRRVIYSESWGKTWLIGLPYNSYLIYLWNRYCSLVYKFHFFKNFYWSHAMGDCYLRSKYCKERNYLNSSPHLPSLSITKLSKFQAAHLSQMHSLVTLFLPFFIKLMEVKVAVFPVRAVFYTLFVCLYNFLSDISYHIEPVTS